MKQPKEIWVLSYVFNTEQWHKNKYIRTGVNGHNTRPQHSIKYISEHNHLEQIEVLKKEIEELKYQLASRNS